MEAIAIIATLAFIGWLIWRAVKGKPIKAYLVSYFLSCIAGAFTLTFFMSMDLPKVLKIMVSIVLGSVLIFLAAWLQRRTKLI